MIHEVKIPTIGESITEGLLSSWRVGQGAVVAKGDVLLELETDKISTELTADVAGKVQLLAAAGDTVSIGQVVAKIEVEEKEAGEKQTDEIDVLPELEEEVVETKASTEKPEEPETKETAEEESVSEVEPTPPILEAVDEEPEVPGERTETESRPIRREKLSPIRKRIAERLLQAQQTTASLTTFADLDMLAVLETRQKHAKFFQDKHGVKLGYMPFFVKAVVYALRCMPQVNSQFENNETIRFNEYYDIGVAMSTERGLVVPVVRDCDNLTLGEIEQAIDAYKNKVSFGSLELSDLEGGVFTITNGGVFGSMLSTPILNPPQAAILGMHAIENRPVVIDDTITIRPRMYLALTYDHRLIDGKEAVQFLQHIKSVIEDPSFLLMQ